MSEETLVITNFQSVLGISMLPNLLITEIWSPKKPPRIGRSDFSDGPLFPTRFLNAIEGRNPLFEFARGSMTINDLLRLNPNHIIKTRGMGQTTIDGIKKCLLWCDENIEILLAFQIEHSKRESNLQNSIADVFNHFTMEMKEKEKFVCNQRLFSLEEVTLQEVAVEIDVTRERVRQMEKRILNKVRDPKTRAQMEINAVILSIYEALTIWQTFDSFLEQMNENFESNFYWWKFEDENESPSDVLKTCLKLLNLLFPKKIQFDGKEIYKAYDKKFFDFLKNVTLIANNHTILAEELYSSLEKMGLREPGIDYLVKKYQLTKFGAFFILPTSNVIDLCIAGLHLIGEPVEIEQLMADLGINKNKNSLGDRLRNDHRVMRVGKKRIALREWEDLDEYEGIAETIERYVKKNNNCVRLKDIQTHLSQFPDISERSVNAYLDAPQYEILDGYVYLLKQQDFRKVKAKFNENTFPLPNDRHKIVHRFRIDDDVRRGSGNIIKTGFAGALNIQPGKKQTFSSQFGEIKIYWNPRLSQPARGSIKHIIEASKMTSELEVFLIFDIRLKTFTLSQSKPF